MVAIAQQQQQQQQQDGPESIEVSIVRDSVSVSSDTAEPALSSQLSSARKRAVAASRGRLQRAAGLGLLALVATAASFTAGYQLSGELPAAPAENSYDSDDGVVGFASPPPQPPPPTSGVAVAPGNSACWGGGFTFARCVSLPSISRPASICLRFRRLARPCLNRRTVLFASSTVRRPRGRRSELLEQPWWLRPSLRRLRLSVLLHTMKNIW